MSDWVKQLKAIDVKKLKLKNGNAVEAELKRHAAILEECIREAVDDVYHFREPQVYVRSYDFYHSIYVKDNIEIEVFPNGTCLSIAIGFNDGAIHKSFTGQDANVAILLNEGWQTYGSFSQVPF